MRQQVSKQAWYTNWAGYQVSTANPTQVHATWFVPTVRWPGRDGYSNAWVGLGGGNATQGQLLQAGTEHDVVCSAVRSGRCTAWRTQYYAWLETFPDRAQERITNLAISPGDAVETTVRWAPAELRAYFTMCNWRTDQCVGASRATSAPKGVAQFVVERPMLGNGRVAALANFGTVTFSGADVKGSAGTVSPKQAANTRISMYNGHSLATAGPMSGYGDSFPVTFNRAV